MEFAQIRAGDRLFLYRVGGIAAAGDRVLLHRFAADGFWAIPGGRVGIGETAAHALRREMQEEIGADVEVGDVLWIIENFFSFRPLDRPADASGEIDHHELGFYLAMTLPDRLVELDAFEGVELEGTPDEFPLEFRWFRRDEVQNLDIRPAVLRDLLSKPLPDGTPTIVNIG